MQEIRLSPSTSWTPFSLRYKVIAAVVQTKEGGEVAFGDLCTFQAVPGKSHKMLGDVIRPGTEISFRGPKGSKAALIVDAQWDSPANYNSKEI